MADMHDAATAEAASLYEFEHGNVTRVRFDAQALAPVLTGNRLGGLQQIATKTLPAMTLGNRNTMQDVYKRQEYVVATIGYCSLVPCFVDAYCVPKAHGLWNAPLSGLSSHGDSNGSKCSGSGPSTML